MKTANAKVMLMEEIALLENRQARELQLLKDQFQITYESIKPLNFIKSTLHDVISSPDIRTDVLNGAINLTTGYLSQKFLLGSSTKKSILGSALQFVLNKFVQNRAN